MLALPFVVDAEEHAEEHELLTIRRLSCLMYPDTVVVAAASFVLGATPTIYSVQILSLLFLPTFLQKRPLSPLSPSSLAVSFLLLVLYLGASQMMIFVVSLSSRSMMLWWEK